MTSEEALAQIRAAVADPDHVNRLAAHHAARTDPWRWYCRICGAEGQDPSRLVRNDQVTEHLTNTRCGSGSRQGRAEVGRLLHIWTY